MLRIKSWGLFAVLLVVFSSHTRMADADPQIPVLYSIIQGKYHQIRPAAEGLDPDIFVKAYIGYINLKVAGYTQSPVMAIVDFNKPSTSPRMWIIDLEQDSLLLHTWSAHGKGSGVEKAEYFSNVPGSLQTSLGFYLTAEEYIGKNGRSLRLDGMDEGFNTNARRRHVVMHGADYVSQDTMNAYGYLGNSEGCPAVSHEVNHQVINWMKNRSVLFITGSFHSYRSNWIDWSAAVLQLTDHAYHQQTDRKSPAPAVPADADIHSAVPGDESGDSG